MRWHGHGGPGPRRRRPERHRRTRAPSRCDLGSWPAIPHTWHAQGTEPVGTTFGYTRCRLPRSWDRFEPGFATVMGPPESPVMGPLSAFLPGWSGPAVCDRFRSFDLSCVPDSGVTRLA